MRVKFCARRHAVAAASDYDDALPGLSQLAKQGRFDEIIEILQFQRRLEPWLYIPNSTALHAIMPYHPTVALTELMIQSLTRLASVEGPQRQRHHIPEASVDARGQTPLHVAATYGCDLAILKRLTEMSHHAVLTRDQAGRLPLHCLVAFSSTTTNNHRGGKKKRTRRQKQDTCSVNNTINCLRHLVDLYPQGCTVRDASGSTPLDLAIQNKCDQRIILTLLSSVQQAVMKYGAAINTTGVAATTSTTTKSSSLDVPFQSVTVVQEIGSDDDVSSVGALSFYFNSKSQSRKRRTMVEI